MQTPLLAFFWAYMGLRDLGSPRGRVLSLHCPSLSYSGHPGPREPLRAPNEHSLRTCTAGTVVLTSARCSLAEVDTAFRKQYRSKEG